MTAMDRRQTRIEEKRLTKRLPRHQPLLPPRRQLREEVLHQPLITPLDHLLQPVLHRLLLLLLPLLRRKRVRVIPFGKRDCFPEQKRN